MLGRTFGPLISKLASLELFSPTVLVSGAVTYLLAKLLNLQFLAIILAIPVTNFANLAIIQTVYFLFIVSIVMPIFVIFITITFAREVARALGTEIDLSALEKII
jgi:hypothetical protein